MQLACGTTTLLYFYIRKLIPRDLSCYDTCYFSNYNTCYFHIFSYFQVALFCLRDIILLFFVKKRRVQSTGRMYTSIYI